MSESTRIAAVRSFFERWNKLDYDGITDYFTDDFLYQLEPEPVGIASYTKPGITKDKFVEFNLEVDKEHKDHQSIIESIHEVGDKITLKARDSVYYEKVGRSEHIFHAEVTFQGDKIQLLKVIIDVGSFSEKWQEYIKSMTAPP